MSVFQVKYRAKNGAVRTEGLEADSRAAALAHVKAQGGTVLSVAEGGKVSRPSSSSSSTPSSSSAKRPTAKANNRTVLRGLLAGALVVVLALGAWFLFLDRAPMPEEVPPPKEPAVRPAVKPAAPKPKAAVPSAPLKKHVGTSFKPAAAPKLTAKVAPPAVESQDVIKLRELMLKFSGPPLFKNDCDNQIAGILSAKPGERFMDPQVDAHFDKAFAESLKDKIEIFEDDPEDVKAQKEAVIAAKDQLAKLLEKGESPASALTDVIKGLNDVADYRDKLEDNLRLLLTEGDSEQDVKDYLVEANKFLAEYNAMELSVSPRRLELFRRKLEEKKQQQAQPLNSSSK